LEKLKIRWGIKAMRSEEKIKEKDEKNLIKKCWIEKESSEKKKLYSKEKKKLQ